MVKKMAVIFVVGLFIMFIFGGGALAATAKKSSKAIWSRSIAGEYNVDGAGYDLLPIPTKYPVKYSLGGSQVVTCGDIAPAVGSIVNHTTVGDTWYDFQKNGSIGRMMSVTNDGYRHFSWTYINEIYSPPGTPRYVDANCVDPTVTDWIGQTHADGQVDPELNAGYCNQTHLRDGTSLIIHHRTAGIPIWSSTLTVDDMVCGGYFSNHYDLPDAIVGSPSGKDMMWPKAEVMWAYDGVKGHPDTTDYIHIVGTEGETAGGVPVMVAYERCYFDPFGTPNDTLVCQAYDGGTKTYRLAANTNGGGSFAKITHFDSSCSITPVVVVSPVSKRVAIAFLKPAGDGSCDYMGDPCYIESMNNGNDWIDGTNWPPPEFNITNFGMTGTERGLRDLSACYDYEDSLHIVYATYGFDPEQPGSYYPGVSRLYHWSKKDGVQMIADAIWEGTDGGAHMANIAKMSVSAKDPIYHPGGAEDSVYLYAIWSQFDTLDDAANALTNSEIYGCGSNDGGNTWGRPFNLTNTHTPGCSWPNCVSENWASMAQNMYDGHLHIQYICDLEPGGAIQDPSTWGAVPVYYLELDEWEIIAECRTGYNIISPAQWHSPPLKVTPGGFRTLDFKVENIGNDDCTFSVSSDDPCIQVSAGGPLAPGQEALVSVTLDGSLCANSFIDGNVILTSSEGAGKTDYLPVQAVVSQSYYECPRDPETVDTLENDYMQFYTNANCQEWMFDISTFQSAIGEDTTIEVYFQGGTIVATTSGDDTLVGRYMGQNDQHAGAQDVIHVDDFATRDYWVLYTSNIFMHNLNPPARDYTWYWFELIKEIVFFKPTASEALQHCVIKYITVERHDPPDWWPTPPPRGYPDTYVGIAMDIDCPFDSAGEETGDENGCNLGRYDSDNHIAYQVGFGRDGEHPAYNTYHAGIAMINGGGGPSGEEEAYKTHCMRNNQYLYPQSPWGWKDGELYELASNTSGGRHQIDFGPDDPDSIVDRTYVVTAQKIEAEGKIDAEERNGCDAKAFFTVVEAVAPNGLSELQGNVAAARAWVNVLPIICGDLNSDHESIVDIGDIVFLLNYVFRNVPVGSEPTPPPPRSRGDVNSDGITDLGDIVYLINYVLLNTPENPKPDPDCPGDWW